MVSGNQIYNRTQKRKLFKPTLLLGKTFISVMHGLNGVLSLGPKSFAISSIPKFIARLDKSPK